jgi:hypothetical protein
VQTQRAETGRSEGWAGRPVPARLVISSTIERHVQAASPYWANMAAATAWRGAPQRRDITAFLLAPHTTLHGLSAREPPKRCTSWSRASRCYEDYASAASRASLRVPFVASRICGLAANPAQSSTLLLACRSSGAREACFITSFSPTSSWTFSFRRPLSCELVRGCIRQPLLSATPATRRMPSPF